MRRSGASILLLLSLLLFLGISLSAFAGQSTRGVFNDSAITASVKTKLANDVRLGTLTGIEVNTTKGEVTLAGKAHTQQEKQLAGQVAGSVDGVKKVHNDLKVVPD